MQKTWNLTYYEDGRPVGERHGVSQDDAVVEMYRLARGEAPVATEPVAAAETGSETGELALVA